MNRLAMIGLMSAVALATLPSCARTGPFTIRNRPAGSISDPPDTRFDERDRSAAYADHDRPFVDAAAHSVRRLPALVEAGSEWTLAELETLALANNPTLAQAQAAINARVGNRLQAGLYPNPRLGYQHTEAGNNGRAGQQGAYLAQKLVRGGKLSLAQRSASHAVQAAEFGYTAQRYRVLTAVRTAFYDVLAARQTIALAEDLVTISQQGIATTEALVRGGQSSRVDLLQVRVELNNANIAVQQARNRYRAAGSRLVAVVGMPNLVATTLVGSLETPFSELDPDEVLQRVLTSSPELAAAHQQVKRAQLALRRAAAEPIPDIDVQAGVQYDYSSEDTFANLQVELPLPIRDRNQGNVMKAQADVTSAQHDVERIELDLRKRFATTYERYANASTRVERYRSSIIPDARESLKLLSDVYQAEGRIDFVRLLIAQRTNFQTQIDYLNALRDRWKAQLEIDGLLLTGGLARAKRDGP